MRLYVFIILFGLLFANDVFSNVLSKTFNPRVVIFNDVSSDELEIRAPQKEFYARYDTDTQTFHELTIPFDVISKKGTTVDYLMTIPIMTSSCNADKETVFFDVNLSIDDKLWDGTGLRFTGINNSHKMKLNYPRIEQKNINQQCTGTIGIQVQMATL
ncbi:hypothetical protein [Photobacterium leiognathi]|uniref:hypothetical protein n=1 Tax=Photobacterium leiognathi TaxID=553611 RepID=UPI002982778F|nr:hypothetical protein [Photobacterium leiognathi]